MTIDVGSLQRWAFDALPVLLDAAVKGTVLLATAGALAGAMRKASPGARQVVWLGALAGVLVLPVASAALPSWQVLPGWARIDISPPSAGSSPVETTGSPGEAGQAGARAAPGPKAELAHAPAAATIALEPAQQDDSPAIEAAGVGKPWRGWIVPGAVLLWLAGTAVCLLPLAGGRQPCPYTRKNGPGCGNPALYRSRSAMSLLHTSRCTCDVNSLRTTA